MRWTGATSTRRVLLIALTVLLTGACGGGGADAPSAAAEVGEVTGGAAELPQLECEGSISTFVVTGTPVGVSLPSHATAGDAVQAAINAGFNGSEYRFVGDDPAGSRYAVLDQAGGVIAEIVVEDTTTGWETAQIAQCEGAATEIVRTDELQRFCAAMTEFTSGAITDVDGVVALAEELRSSAPEYIRSDAEEFARLVTLVSTAFGEAGAATGVQVDIEPFLAGLPPDARQFVFDFTEGAQSGDLRPDSLVGRVFRFFLANCEG